MMKIFVNNNAAFLFIIVLTTIDASRILYLPLPKIHPLNHELKSSPISHESIMKPYEEKLISDAFIPLSAMERSMYEKQEESKKRDNFDWEELLDQEAAVAAAKHFININERPHTRKQLDYLMSLDRETRKPTKVLTNYDDEMEAAINNPSQLSEKKLANEPVVVDSAISRTARLQSNGDSENIQQQQQSNGVAFYVIIGTSSLVGILGIVAAAIFWYKIHQKAQTAIDTEYPSYGVTGPTNNGTKMSPSSTISDRKLAQSAQMFHYQQQRQQMMAQEKTQFDTKPVHSDDSDDEGHGGGDYTVYECPGLAPTGEMEVRNPLFAEPDASLTSPTSASHPTTNNHYPQLSSTTSSSSPPKEKSLS